MTRKRRGAPAGNRNALKHGLYSAAFKQHERRLLDQFPAAGVGDEVDLLRVAMVRFLEALNSTPEPLDIDTQLAALRAITLSARSITSLLRVQALVGLGSSEELGELLRILQPGRPPSPAARSASTENPQAHIADPKP